MRVLRYLLLACFILTFMPLQPHAPTIADTAYAQDDCAQRAVPSRLDESGVARVILNGDGVGVVFRDAPGKERSGSNIIRALPEGEILNIIQGPICVEANIWWEVSLPNGERGWVSEGDVTTYYIEPYTIFSYILQPSEDNPRELNSYQIDVNGNARLRDTFVVPQAEPAFARDVWQEPDLLAAEEALANRRAECPLVLADTPWDSTLTAGDVQVPDDDFDAYLSPDGGKVFVIRHRTVLMPDCQGGTGRYFGLSEVELITRQDVIPLFPYGQSTGARSKDNCFSPDVTNFAQRTFLSEIEWSPDADTVAFVARYIDQDEGGRPCAFYYLFYIDVFSAQITGVAEAQRVAWGEGGTRLYYFTQTTDNGYNVLDFTFWQLENGETTSIGLQSDSFPLPRAFDSTNVYLPWSNDGRKALICTSETGCDGVYSFDIPRREPTAAVPRPENFEAFQVEEIAYVAGDTRIIWLTTTGQAYMQSLVGIDSGNVSPIAVDGTPNGVGIDKMHVMPSGLYVIFELTDGTFALFDTIGRETTLIGDITQAALPSDDASGDDSSVDTDDADAGDAANTDADTEE